MINISQTTITNTIVHGVRAEEGQSIINEETYVFANEEEEELLKKVFLKPFINHAQTFEFTHDVALDYNVLFNTCKNINLEDNFVKHSASIAQHLLASSKHHQIKDADLFIVQFDHIILNNTSYKAVGIYKYEEKDSFIETDLNNHSSALQFKKGIGSKKPDKACMIIFTNEPYTILTIENTRETDYWQNEFIKLKPKEDNVNHTNNFLTLTKDFITAKVPEEFEVNRTDQIDLLNRSVEYFKNNETFEKEEFEKQVFQDEQVIESFRSFDKNFQQSNELEMADSFEISEQAVKKQARVFKSVLKLDKNFHIYIHGDKDLIEQGVEKDGRKFYKIYYEDEK